MIVKDDGETGELEARLLTGPAIRSASSAIYGPQHDKSKQEVQPTEPGNCSLGHIIRPSVCPSPIVRPSASAEDSYVHQCSWKSRISALCSVAAVTDSFVLL